MIVIIDNYDSFTYNLVQYFGELGCEVEVFRNDAITVSEIRDLTPSHIVISPGPGEPSSAGVSKDIILELGPHVPTLGVCLGHQCIGQAFGGKVERAHKLMHGKTSPVFHQDDALFTDVSNPFEATRYHSLIVVEPLPSELEILACTKEGEVMALRHKSFPIYGVQFHPESILTIEGKRILRNFISVGRTMTVASG
jgi:anthranilate synthase/aminodeoxychorismate synthase-like glutamine amidotransferase